MIIEQLACKLGRKDEEPNIKLANNLCKENNNSAIAEVVEGLYSKDKAIASDCIKVLYEIGGMKPELIADYASDFLGLLLSKNNRLAWGSMTALATITDIKYKEIFSQIELVKQAYEKGSVITIDNSITVFSKLCKADKEYERELFPLLIHHLDTCRGREVPQHGERIFLCINSENGKEFVDTLERRKPELTETQAKRINKLIKKLL